MIGRKSGLELSKRVLLSGAWIDTSGGEQVVSWVGLVYLDRLVEEVVYLLVRIVVRITFGVKGTHTGAVLSLEELVCVKELSQASTTDPTHAPRMILRSHYLRSSMCSYSPVVLDRYSPQESV